MSSSIVADASQIVLIIDDHVGGADLLRDLLELLGYDVHVVYTGEAGLELMCTLIPWLVLLDIHLPGIDGYEVARRIKAMPALVGTRIIAQTALGRREDAERAKAAGCDDHLIKPLSVPALKAALAVWR